MLSESRDLCHAIILTVLNVEFSAVLAHLEQHREVRHQNGNVYEVGSFSTQGGVRKIALAQVGKGNASAAFEVERAIAYFNPSVALFIGVAGGLKDVCLGDVVAATKVYGYESGKAGKDFSVRPEVGSSTYSMEQCALAVARKEDWLQRIKGRSSIRDPHAFIAPIAAGEKVINSTRSSVCQLLRTSYGDALAIEMEGHGFLSAVRAREHIQALIVRGISDLLDGKSEADAAGSQSIAARHASAFAFEVLAKLEIDDYLVPTTLISEDRGERKSLVNEVRGITNRSMVNNFGSIQGSFQLGSNNTLYHIINQAPAKDNAVEGRNQLQKGQDALCNGYYVVARQHLEQAACLLPTDLFPLENAQVRYVQALTDLGGKRPFGVTLHVVRHVEELMQMAVGLSPAWSYLYTFALFKRDFARNGWFQARYVQEAEQLIQQSKFMPFASIDEGNMALLSRCQPQLLHAAQE